MSCTKAYGLSNPTLYTDPSGRVFKEPDGGSIDPCANLSTAMASECYRLGGTVPTGWKWAEETGQGQDNHECVGNPMAVEIRVKFGDGIDQPACLNAPETILEPRPEQPKQKSWWEIVTEICSGIRFAASGEEEDETQPALNKASKSLGSMPTQSKGKIILLHGSDEQTVNDIIANGVSPSKAAKLGGGDVFWALPESEIEYARFFADANPRGGRPAILGIELTDTSFETLLSQRWLTTDASAGFSAYQITGWQQLNKVARFFRYE